MEHSFKKLVPLKDIFKSTIVLLHIAWQADKVTVFLYYFTAVIGGLIGLAVSWVIKILIDQLQTGQIEGLTSVPYIIVFTLMARYVVSLVQDLMYYTYHTSYLDYLLRYKLQNAVTKHFIQKVSQLDIAHFENPNTQDLITRVKETMKWQLPDFMRHLGFTVRDIIAYLSAFIILLPFGWWIPFVITLITVPRLYLRGKYGALQWSYWGAGAPENRKLWYYDWLFTNPVAIREMKIAQSADILIEKFDRIQDYLLELNRVPLLKYLKVSILPPLIETMVIIGIAYVFLDDVVLMTLSIGTFTLLLNMLSQLNGTAASASSNVGTLYADGLYLYNFVEMLNIPPAISKPSQPIKIDASRPPKIEFRNVSFAYPDGPKVLHDISFMIKPGESVALVGQNGAGKSTIINLLCRFYDVSSGAILINDIDIKNIDLTSWYSALGTLFQEYVQYHFTVKENIAFEQSENAPLEALIAAAKKSGAHAFIEKLPKAYDQQLGREFEEGEELSGGQWQKLAIARAFFNQPPVLILDEPTSAIDAEAEYEIFNNLEAQYQHKSLILVSHRFSTVRNADRIFVINEGKITERGTHEELLALGGEYANMFLAQAKGYH